MTTISALWTENQEFHASASLAAAASISDNIDLAANGYDVISIQPKIVFGGSPDGNVVVEIFSSPDSGSTFDSEPLHSIAITEATGETKAITITIKDTPFIKIKTTNNDSTDSVTYSGIYAGKEYTSV